MILPSDLTLSSVGGTCAKAEAANAQAAIGLDHLEEGSEAPVGDRAHDLDTPRFHLAEYGVGPTIGGS